MAPEQQEDTPKKNLTAAQEIFVSSPDDYKNIIRLVLKEERDVMHMRTRTHIHQKIYNHIRQVIR